ncbi:uncharacterized protein LOC126905311 isoform X2 [Daktulosphaira vitifoliae]|uniref:uncharacterized protein LOC126905311 isoform X2 n=1 Tax=Daktulosphaira vitifoliae TaxID=58002 RepID=UPI0021AA347F|nr:uncharacterized protein LOC126905311 isoform X2 [Daktulosphaira vitifoliae]
MSNPNKSGHVRSLLKKFQSLRTVVKKSSSRVPALIQTYRENVVSIAKRSSHKNTRVSEIRPSHTTLQSSPKSKKPNPKKQTGLKTSAGVTSPNNEPTNMSNPTARNVEENIRVPNDLHSKVIEKIDEFIKPKATVQRVDSDDNNETDVLSVLIQSFSEKLERLQSKRVVKTTEINKQEKSLKHFIENCDILGEIQEDIRKELMSRQCNVYKSTSFSSHDDDGSTTGRFQSPHSDSHKTPIVENISSLSDPIQCDVLSGGEQKLNDSNGPMENNIHSELGGNSAAGDCQTPHKSEQDVVKKPSLIVFKLEYCEPSTSHEVLEHNAGVLASTRFEIVMETDDAGIFSSDDSSDDYEDAFEYFKSSSEPDDDLEYYSWAEY